MSKTTNKRIWMAGHFDTKRTPMRELPNRSALAWRGVVARAKQLLADGDRLIVIVATANSLCTEPSAHDILNAQLTALVISKQEFARSFEMIKTYLQDQSECRFEVETDLKRIERKFRTKFLAQRKHQLPGSPIPSPVACFLIDQCTKKKRFDLL